MNSIIIRCSKCGGRLQGPSNHTGDFMCAGHEHVETELDKLTKHEKSILSEMVMERLNKLLKIEKALSYKGKDSVFQEEPSEAKTFFRNLLKKLK